MKTPSLIDTAKETEKVVYGTRNPGELLDSVSGAPFRQAVSKLQDDFTDVPGALHSAAMQVGRDSSSAPSMEDIVEKAGVKDERLQRVLGFLGSFAEPGVPGMGAVMGMAKKVGKGPKKMFDVLGDNEHLAAKIGKAEKVGEESFELGRKAELYETDQGFKRVVARDEDGNIVASAIFNPEGKVEAATKMRANYPDPDRLLNEGIRRFITKDMDYHERWPISRDLSDKTNLRGELKAFPEGGRPKPTDPFSPKGEVIGSGQTPQELADTIRKAKFEKEAQDLIDYAKTGRYVRGGVPWLPGGGYEAMPVMKEAKKETERIANMLADTRRKLADKLTTMRREHQAGRIPTESERAEYDFLAQQFDEIDEELGNRGSLRYSPKRDRYFSKGDIDTAEVKPFGPSLKTKTSSGPAEVVKAKDIAEELRKVRKETKIAKDKWLETKYGAAEYEKAWELFDALDSREKRLQRVYEMLKRKPKKD